MATDSVSDPFQEDQVTAVYSRLAVANSGIIQVELEVLTRKPVCFAIFGKPVLYDIDRSTPVVRLRCWC